MEDHLKELTAACRNRYLVLASMAGITVALFLQISLVFGKYESQISISDGASKKKKELEDNIASFDKQKADMEQQRKEFIDNIKTVSDTSKKIKEEIETLEKERSGLLSLAGNEPDNLEGLAIFMGGSKFIYIRTGSGKNFIEKWAALHGVRELSAYNTPLTDQHKNLSFLISEKITGRPSKKQNKNLEELNRALLAHQAFHRGIASLDDKIRQKSDQLTQVLSKLDEQKKIKPLIDYDEKIQDIENQKQQIMAAAKKEEFKILSLVERDKIRSDIENQLNHSFTLAQTPISVEGGLLAFPLILALLSMWLLPPLERLSSLVAQKEEPSAYCLPWFGIYREPLSCSLFLVSLLLFPALPFIFLLIIHLQISPVIQNINLGYNHPLTSSFYRFTLIVSAIVIFIIGMRISFLRLFILKKEINM